MAQAGHGRLSHDQMRVGDGLCDLTYVEWGSLIPRKLLQLLPKPGEEAEVGAGKESPGLVGPWLSLLPSSSGGSRLQLMKGPLKWFHSSIRALLEAGGWPLP